MSKLRPSTVYTFVAGAVIVTLIAKWQSLGMSDQTCVRQIGMGLTEFIPQCRSQIGGWSTNSLGIRDDELAAQIRDSTQTVLYLGWAEPLSAQMPNSSLMPSRLQQRLNSATMLSKPFRVINGSGPSAGGILRIRRVQELFETYRPQLIVYLFIPQSEHIQHAALKRYGDTNSPWATQRDLIRLSWSVRMVQEPGATIMGAAISDLRDISALAERNNSRLIVVWPGTGLALSAWNLRLPLAVESLAIRFFDSLKIVVGSSAERIRLLLIESQISFYEAADLGAVFGRRMAFSESEQINRSARVVDRLVDIIEREYKMMEK